MRNTIKMYIADELRGLRAKANVTIVELSKSIGISKDTISRYENGSISINIDTLEKLLDYYNTDFDIFFKNVCANKHNAKEKEE